MREVSRKFVARGDEEVYLIISIVHFSMSDKVKIKICIDLAEKDLSISQKLLVVVKNLVEEVHIC